MNAIHPAFVTALRPFAPLPDVTCKVVRSGRIHELEFRGDDRDATYRAANVRMSQIDPYRSPAVVAQRKDVATGEYVVLVRYYNLD
ncbi:hypothetical protein AB4120_14970 [Cupriavidus sp. 2KB_3]|uniref:hypothetical protein n=1 Tax=Cupriavidus sp. 2KB_3 TaxID=3232980 RepID=UPI003F91759B